MQLENKKGFTGTGASFKGRSLFPIIYRAGVYKEEKWY
jgi:hypothetical protein